MLMKFGLLIDVELRKTVTSSNLKPEVALSRRGCQLDNRYNKVMISFNVKYRNSKTAPDRAGQPIESRAWSIERRHFQ